MQTFNFFNFNRAVMMKFYNGLMINEGAIVLLLQGMTFITILQR